MRWLGWLLVVGLAPTALAAQVHPAGHATADSRQALAFAGASVGTNRQPASIEGQGVHRLIGSWSVMLHGDATINGRWERAPRGEDDVFFTNMLMASARRGLGVGWIELSARASLEPALGPRGYALLLQTGESADGVVPLVDRQHPHDALVEASASFRAEIEEGAWAFLYVAPVGSPAFGPVPYMHRPSGSANPVTPISHHFLDSSHITHGVLTGGVFNETLQAEVSWFNGLESDASRWTPEVPGLDSWSARISITRWPDWVIQASHASVNEPERLHPGIDAYRSTMSVMHHVSLGDDLSVSTTLAYGQNIRRRATMTIAEARARLSAPLLQHYLGTASLPPNADETLLLLFKKRVQSAVLAETSIQWRSVTGFARYERALKDELFPPPDLRHSSFYTVGKVDAGVVLDVLAGPWFALGIGGSVSSHSTPSALSAAYGTGASSYMLFSRVRF